MTAWITGATVQGWIGADKITSSSADSLADVVTDAVRSAIERDVELVTGINDYYDSNGTDFILLNYWPVVSIGSVTYNAQAVAPAMPQQPGWVLDHFNPRKLKFAGMGKLPRGTMNIQVLGLSAGYDLTQAIGFRAPPGAGNGLPGHLAQALWLTAAAFFNSQAADPNLTSESMAGVFSGSFHAGGVGSVPPGALRLLEREMRSAP